MDPDVPLAMEDTVAVEVDGKATSHSSAWAICESHHPLELKLGIITTLSSRARKQSRRKEERRPTCEAHLHGPSPSLTGDGRIKPQ